MEKSVSISLDDDNLKDVVEVLGSKSCRRILDLLAEDELAVSDIALRLKMKLNTVDYNVKKLVRAGLIEKSDHWWSVKGKKVLTYRVCNKSIVISPKRKVAKKFLWILGLVGALGIWIRQMIFRNVEVARDFVEDALFDVASKAEMMVSNDGATQSVVGSEFWASLASWEWFLAGVWVTLVLFFVWGFIFEKKNR